MGIVVARCLEMKGMNHAITFWNITRIWNKFFAKSNGLLSRQKRQETRATCDGSTDKATERVSCSKAGDGQC